MQPSFRSAFALVSGVRFFAGASVALCVCAVIQGAATSEGNRGILKKAKAADQAAGQPAQSISPENAGPPAQSISPENAGPSAASISPENAGPPAASAEPVEAAEVIEVHAPGESGAPRAAEFEALRAEVESMRNDLSQIRQTLDMLVNQVMADLENENAQLRAELQRIGAERDQFGYANFPSVPRPGGELVEQVLSETPPETGDESPEETGAAGKIILGPDGDETDASDAGADAAPSAPSTPFEYRMVQEWGRTPEEAKELGENASSLKGAACVVPVGAAKEDLEKLGRDLREQYNGYDNINIEVFDDPVAAHAFAGQNVSDPGHHVLSVSKHAPSGRDVILVYINGQPVEAAR